MALLFLRIIKLGNTSKIKDTKKCYGLTNAFLSVNHFPVLIKLLKIKNLKFVLLFTLFDPQLEHYMLLKAQKYTFYNGWAIARIRSKNSNSSSTFDIYSIRFALFKPI